jgi:DNA-binding SARP family transcriptional activator/tetratricopeptide (TPR) repeat protein
MEGNLTARYKPGDGGAVERVIATNDPHTGTSGVTPPAEWYLARPTREQLDRPSVSELLNGAAKRRICVVIGAAGWGKTTAVAAWACSRPSAWLRYEDYEGDARRLLDNLLAALRLHVLLPAPRLDPMAAPVDSITAICTWLQSALSRDLTVIFDDLHGLAAGSDIADVMRSLCQRAPEQLHLILISRCELPFSVQRLRGRGLVAEIHAPDLAFDIADVDALLRLTVGREPAGLPRQVYEHTGGWPAAVHFTVEMLRTIAPSQRSAVVEQLAHPGQRFHDYLAEEIVGAAPEWAQQLLRRLAIFGEVTSATAIARELDNPATAVAELSRQGLVRRSDAGAGWSLIRPLRDFFEYEAATPASERKALHASAADDCIGRGATADALRHLLAAGDYAGCVTLLVDHGDALVESGHVDIVLQAAQLPPSYVDDPRIQRLLGEAQQVRGQWAQAQQHFQRANYDQDKLDPALAWRVGLVAWGQGEFSNVHAVAQRTRSGQHDTADEVLLLALTGHAYRMTGDLTGLQRATAQAEAAAQQCGDLRAWSSVHFVLAVQAAATGAWRPAVAYFSDALRGAEATDDLLKLMSIRVSRAFHHFEMGAPRQALADAQVALSLSERCEYPSLVAHALTVEGRARARIGMLEAAAGSFATAIDLFQRIGSRFLAWPLCGRGDLHRTRGQLARARADYEEALTLAQPYHDVLGLSSALIGLARVSAYEDPQHARECAERAVNLGESLREIPALLTRGWVELMGGDRRAAATDARRAATTARRRQDNPGLAEAITLGVLAANPSRPAATQLREAIEIWQETGCRVEEAVTRVVAARLGLPLDRADAELSSQLLAELGIDVESRKTAGPLGVLVCFSPVVSIQTLGVFRVIREGFSIPQTAWKSKKARDLLKILISRRRPTPRDQLMDLLWPDASPAVAGNRLSVLLSTVRDVLAPHPLGENPLITDDGAVSLNRTQVSVDVEDFLSQAAVALEADRVGAPDRVEKLTSAVNAHTGDFLEDDPYHEWSTTMVEEVRATYITLLRALTLRLREARDTDATVRYTLRLLGQDRYDEEANLRLVGVLFDAGRLGEARRHHQNYERRMVEIGVEPSPFPAQFPGESAVG